MCGQVAKQQGEYLAEVFSSNFPTGVSSIKPFKVLACMFSIVLQLFVDFGEGLIF